MEFWYYSFITDSDTVGLPNTKGFHVVTKPSHSGNDKLVQVFAITRNKKEIEQKLRKHYQRMDRYFSYEVDLRYHPKSDKLLSEMGIPPLAEDVVNWPTFEECISVIYNNLDEARNELPFETTPESSRTMMYLYCRQKLPKFNVSQLFPEGEVFVCKDLVY